MAEGTRVSAADLELVVTAERAGSARLKDLRKILERETIQKALAQNNGNVSQTAADLGLSRPTLYGLMVKLGIRRD